MCIRRFLPKLSNYSFDIRSPPPLERANFGCIWKFSSLYLFSRNDILFYQSFVLWFFYYLISNKYCYNSNTHIHIYIWSKYAILNVRVTVITQTHTHIYTIQICNLKYWKETNWSLAKISSHFIFKYKEKREEKNNLFSYFHRFPSAWKKREKKGSKFQPLSLLPRDSKIRNTVFGPRCWQEDKYSPLPSSPSWEAEIHGSAIK